MSEPKFFTGVWVSEPKTSAPPFVIANVSFKVGDVVNFMNENANEYGYVNAVIKKGRSGRYYMELNNWNPRKADDDSGDELPPIEDDNDDLPF